MFLIILVMSCNNKNLYKKNENFLFIDIKLHYPNGEIFCQWTLSKYLISYKKDAKVITKKISKYNLDTLYQKLIDIDSNQYTDYYGCNDSRIRMNEFVYSFFYDYKYQFKTGHRYFTISNCFLNKDINLLNQICNHLFINKNITELPSFQSQSYDCNCTKYKIIRKYD